MDIFNYFETDPVRVVLIGVKIDERIKVKKVIILSCLIFIFIHSILDNGCPDIFVQPGITIHIRGQDISYHFRVSPGRPACSSNFYQRRIPGQDQTDWKFHCFCRHRHRPS